MSHLQLRRNVRNSTAVTSVSGQTVRHLEQPLPLFTNSQSYSGDTVTGCDWL